MAKRQRQSAKRRLAAWFNEHGCTRSAPDPKLRKEHSKTYKRGYEVRLSAHPEELSNLSALLHRTGFKPGTPFPKGNRFVVPLYGKEQVQRFLQMIEQEGDPA